MTKPFQVGMLDYHSEHSEESVYQNMGTNEDNISRYLRYLQKAGWSDLIDDRWRDLVYDELIHHFPNMTDDKWKRIEKVVFI